MVGGGRDYRGLRPDHEAVARALPRRRVRRTLRPPQGAAESQTDSVPGSRKVPQLYREKYFDFNVRHFHEKLQEEHGIQISYTG